MTDIWRGQIRIEFKLQALGEREAGNRLASIRGWLVKGAGYLARRGWIESVEIVVEDPVKVGEKKLATRV